MRWGSYQATPDVTGDSSFRQCSLNIYRLSADHFIQVRAGQNVTGVVQMTDYRAARSPGREALQRRGRWMLNRFSGAGDTATTLAADS